MPNGHNMDLNIPDFNFCPLVSLINQTYGPDIQLAINGKTLYQLDLFCLFPQQANISQSSHLRSIIMLPYSTNTKLVLFMFRCNQEVCTFLHHALTIQHSVNYILFAVQKCIHNN